MTCGIICKLSSVLFSLFTFYCFDENINHDKLEYIEGNENNNYEKLECIEGD